VDTPLPGRGPAKLPKLPVHSTAFTMGLRRPAPTLGEHTREVLRELGLETDEIDALASRRVIA
jgi:crotonobetainyl-CoA:carnitine CoA-transferase CaiB-like acyl-CoA transferase